MAKIIITTDFRHGNPIKHYPENKKPVEVPESVAEFALQSEFAEEVKPKGKKSADK